MIARTFEDIEKTLSSGLPQNQLGRSLALPLFFPLALFFARPWAARVVQALILLVAHFCVWHSSAFAMERNLPGFETLAPFGEQVRWTRLESGVRVFVNARGELSKQPRRLLVFATPNGNSIEQTLGCQAGDGIDWHFQIQHVAAQVRALRALDPDHEWILAVVQAPKLSWPMFRKDNPDASGVIHNIVRTLQADCDTHDVVLCCHSGGGAFLWEYIASVETIPTEVSRIIFLDANYSYSDEVGHGDRLLAWLKMSTDRKLIVVAYDDREIELNGKKVIEGEGGTWRASERMLKRIRLDTELKERELGLFQCFSGLVDQIQFFLHRNPENKILHTRLVGEMNGVLGSLTLGTPIEKAWGAIGGPPAFNQWIQPQPFVEGRSNQAFIPRDGIRKTLIAPPRAPGSVTGSEFQNQVSGVARGEREAAIVRELLAGNSPESSKQLVPVQVGCVDKAGVSHSGIVFVMPDYLAIGDEVDSFRIPLSPNSAVQVADAFGASLITAKISDDIFAAATARLEPLPLTKDRDSMATFFEHHRIIVSELVAHSNKRLVAGIKKDVVFSNALMIKPHRVAIYGWHMPDGRPIQGLYAGHVDWYVDYSHGIRLMSNEVIVDNRPMGLAELLKDPDLCALLSNEGTLDLTQLRKGSQW